MRDKQAEILIKDHKIDAKLSMRDKEQQQHHYYYPPSLLIENRTIKFIR